MFIDALNISYFSFKKHKFGFLELDALTSQKIVLPNVISEHPLENGEILNDAIHNLPLEIKFSAVISDLAQNYKEELEVIGDVAKTIFTSKKLKSSKSIRAWQELYNLWTEKKLVTITSPIQNKPFENMAIKNIEVTLDSTYSLNFSADLKQVLISENLKKLNLAPEVGKQSKRL